MSKVQIQALLLILMVSVAHTQSVELATLQKHLVEMPRVMFTWLDTTAAQLLLQENLIFYGTIILQSVAHLTVPLLGTGCSLFMDTLSFNGLYIAYD